MTSALSNPLLPPPQQLSYNSSGAANPHTHDHRQVNNPDFSATATEDALTTPPTTTTATTATNSDTTNGVKKRVRTGCLNCRRKHKKCDENKPVCHGCIAKNEVCQWPDPSSKRRNRRHSFQVLPSQQPLAPPAPLSSLSTYALNPIAPTSQLPLPSTGNGLGLTPAPKPGTGQALNISSGTGLTPAPKPGTGQATGFTPAPKPGTGQALNISPGTGFTPAPKPGTGQALNKWPGTGPPNDSVQLSAIQLGFPVPPPSTQAFTPRQDVSSTMSANEKRRHDLFNYSLAPNPLNGLASKSDISTYSSISNKVEEIAPSYSQSDYQLSTSILPDRSESVDLKPRELNTDELARLKELVNTLQIYLTNSSSGQDQLVSPLIIREDDQIKFMKEYVVHVAPFLDVEGSFFANEAPVLMREEPALMYAIFALTSLSTSSYSSPLSLFKQSLNLLMESRPSQISYQNQTASHDCTILLLTLFLYRHSLHTPIVPHLNSTNPSINFHFTLLRLTLSQRYIPDTSMLSQSNPHTLLPLLSIHQQDFLSSFTRAADIDKSLKPTLQFDHSPFPQILVSSPQAIHTHLLTDTARVLLLSHKPMDVKVRSRPVAHYAKKVCGVVATNKERCPWYASWCLYIVGRVLTHESEHAVVLQLIKELGEGGDWATKLDDYWEGRSDV